MNLEEAEKLVTKTMNVILSCKNYDQLKIAVNYAELAYRAISKEIGMINKTRFLILINRAIGYAQSNIENKQLEKSE